MSCKIYKLFYELPKAKKRVVGDCSNLVMTDLDKYKAKALGMETKPCLYITNSLFKRLDRICLFVLANEFEISVCTKPNALGWYVTTELLTDTRKLGRVNKL